MLSWMEIYKKKFIWKDRRNLSEGQDLQIEEEDEKEFEIKQIGKLK